MDTRPVRTFYPLWELELIECKSLRSLCLCVLLFNSQPRMENVVLVMRFELVEGMVRMIDGLIAADG